MSFKTSTLAAVLSASLFACTTASAQITPGTITVQLENRVTIPGASGAPLVLVNAGDARLFVAGQNGTIHTFTGSTLNPTPFLDMAAAGLNLVTGGETGLLGLAFHPNYSGAAGSPGAGKIYTYTSETRVGTPEFNHPELVADGGGSHHNVIREWTVSVGNANAVDPASSRVLFQMNHPLSNHNGGGLAFGPDGYLYISVGDGGGSYDSFNTLNNPDDGHTNSVAGGPHGNAQDRTNVYGDILRIKPTTDNDANSTLSPNGQYRVPNSNPFVDGAGGNADEIFAYGFRNPFRMSFDSDTGVLWVGDVGQNTREEVDLVTIGGNYGWVTKEGTVTVLPYSQAGLIDPVAEYTSSEGHSVIGGFIYHGSLIPELEGMYVFGDAFGPSFAGGRLLYMDPADGQIHDLFIDPLGDQVNGFLYSFGQDINGELYATFSSGLVVALNPVAVPEPRAALLVAGLAVGLLVARRRSRSPRVVV